MCTAAEEEEEEVRRREQQQRVGRETSERESVYVRTYVCVCACVSARLGAKHLGPTTTSNRASECEPDSPQQQQKQKYVNISVHRTTKETIERNKQLIHDYSQERPRKKT